MSETITLIAVVSAVVGSIFSVIKGYTQSGEKFKVGRLTSSLIFAVFSSFALVNFGMVADQFSTLGLVGLIVSYLLIGFGADQGVSKLDK